MRLSIVLFLLLMSYDYVGAQDQDMLIVTGQIRNIRGAVIRNVSVLVKGTTVSTTTNKRGRYAIHACNDDYLMFFLAGYKTLELPVDNRPSIDTTLEKIPAPRGYVLYSIPTPPADGNDTLYIIDGVQHRPAVGQSSNPLNYMDPEEIKTRKVLRYEDATAVFGTYGEKGVMLITTRKKKPSRQKK